MADEKKLIYIVEDHDMIRESVKQYLLLSGYLVEGYSTIASEREAIRKKTPDLLIQDVMLPDGDGFLFVKDLHKNAEVPVIFMTARVEESDKILGFELGADDYITKPFSPKELVMRVKAVLRRKVGGDVRPTVEKKDGHFVIQEHAMEWDEKDHRLEVDGRSVVLTSAEWRILAFLIYHAPDLVARSQILESCFDYSLDSYDRIVDTHIKNIRSKLGEGPWIETVRGYGYRFSGHRP